MSASATRRSAANSASVGVRPSAAASLSIAAGIPAPFRSRWRLFCSTFTTIRSPTTRTLCVWEYGSANVTDDTVRGRRGSDTSRIVVPWGGFM